MDITHFTLLECVSTYFQAIKVETKWNAVRGVNVGSSLVLQSEVNFLVALYVRGRSTIWRMLKLILLCFRYVNITLSLVLFLLVIK